MGTDSLLTLCEECDITVSRHDTDSLLTLRSVTSQCPGMGTDSLLTLCAECDITVSRYDTDSLLTLRSVTSQCPDMTLTVS